MEIQLGVLEGVPFVPSPNVGGTLRPEAIVAHYTAGPSLTRAVATLTRPKSTSNPKPASAHVVIGPDGKTVQLVPFNRQSWHAGPSEWAGRPSLNRWSVGIELVNPGWLKGGPGAYRTWWGDPVPDADVIIAKHPLRPKGRPQPWRIYPDAQIAACYAVCASLCDKYPGIKLMLGHDDVAPGRKYDPGPAFPMAKLRGWLGLGPTGTPPA